MVNHNYNFSIGSQNSDAAVQKYFSGFNPSQE